MLTGVDVSSYNASYDPAGLDFVFVKATEGRSYINPRQVAQSSRARSAGAVVGFYHFLWPGNIVEQAQFFVEKCASVVGDLFAVDWERTSDGSASSCAEKDQFIREVKKLRPGHRVVLYCNRDFWLNRDTTAYTGDGLWIADYVSPGTPRIRQKWIFHQYTDVPLDKNVGNFSSRQALQSWVDSSQVAVGETVSLSKVIAAAKTDPSKSGTPVSYGGVRSVEISLAAEGLLSNKYVDGHFGAETVVAYQGWQHRLGFSGKDADGVPGRVSLTRLGEKHGFDVED